MSLFPIVALPFAFLLFMTLVFRVQGSYLKAFQLFIIGMFAALPLAFLYILLRRGQPVVFTFLRIYSRHFFTDQGLYFILGMAILIILKVSKFAPLEENLQVGASAFFFGLFTAATVVEMVLFRGRYNYYLLFLSPLLRVCLSYGGGLLASYIFEEFDFKRYFFGFIALCLPALFSFVPALAVFNFGYVSFILTGIYAGATAFFIWYLRGV